MGAYVASQLVKAMVKDGIAVRGARVLILGLTFKENTPDLRNSRIIDVVRELEDFGIVVDVHDPWADAAEAQREYGVELLDDLDEGLYDGVVLAVAHNQFRDMGADRIRGLGKKDATVLYDLKHTLAADDADLRL